MAFSYALDRKRHTVKGKANCESEDHKNYKNFPSDVICNDQSLLNIHFCQSWLELSPFWNWQNSDKVNLVGKFVSPYLIHFVGATKIWNADNGCLPGKYHATFSVYSAEQVLDTQSLMVF
jgi:lipopolysaccharide biosynthesis glycosyltransferase